MFDFQISDTTAHIPDDIIFLPVITKSLCQSIIGFIDDMKGRVVRSLETAFIEWDQRVSSF